MGLSHSDQIPGRCYHLGTKKNQDGAIPFRSNTRALLSFRNIIPGWGYHHQIKYKGGDIPFRSNTRTALSFRNKKPRWGYPFRPITRTGVPPSNQIGAKYNDGVIPFRPNTRAGIPPLRSNTRTVLSFRGKLS